MSKVNVSVSIDEEHISQILEVATRLNSAGMNIEHIMENLGIIVGSIDSEKMNTLAQIEGVEHCEPEQEYHLPPPDSEIQ